MNPGKLNHRIKFSQTTQTTNPSGGQVVTEVAVVCSDSTPTDTTWGDLQPIRQYNQWALESGASVLNGDKILIIRYRKDFQPTKSMLFEDMETPGDVYTVHAISPYYQGQKQSFQNNEQTVYKDKVFVFILGKKRS